MIAEQLAHTHKLAFTDSRAWSADEFATLLIQKTTLAVGNADCFILGRVHLDEAEILTLATSPKFQRQGRAKAALQDFLTQIAANGVTTVFLEVAADNEAALGLYQKNGFKQVGLRKGYYRRAHQAACDAIVLQLTLPQR
jgi:ribosomal-protein-alanine N-acetyltransferase